MAGNLDLEAWREAVGAGSTDTVLVCFTDVQGRLIGKRVTGHYFLEQVVHEMHACDYLLALDMDMEPVPGYAAASWDKGYIAIAAPRSWEYAAAIEAAGPPYRPC